MTKNRIGFNIWDDYHDDGYVPNGESQDTYSYVEEEMDEVEKEAIAKIVFDYISKNFPTVKVRLRGADVEFVGLTHTRREKLVHESGAETWDRLPGDSQGGGTCRCWPNL